MKAHWVTSSRLERVLAARYPFGVSRRTRPSAAAAEKKLPVAGVLFVAAVGDSPRAEDAFAGPQGELLLKAVVQGLNWKRDEIDLHFIYANSEEHKKSSDKTGRQNVWQQLKQSIVKAGPRAVVALGEEVATALDLPRQPLSATLETRSIERDGICFIGTAELGEVVRSADVKRLFWNDLKSFSARLKK